MTYETHLPKLTAKINELVASYKAATGRALDVGGAKARTEIIDGVYSCVLSFPCGAELVAPFDAAAQDRIAAGHATKH